jgi:hypothetical protein
MAAKADLSDILDLIPDKEARAFWKRAYEDEITAQDIANELSDMYILIDNVPKVYMAVTGGKLSKPNYYAHEVIGEFEDYLSKMVDERVKDELEVLSDQSCCPHPSPDKSDQLIAP